MDDLQFLRDPFTVSDASSNDHIQSLVYDCQDFARFIIYIHKDRYRLSSISVEDSWKESTATNSVPKLGARYSDSHSNFNTLIQDL